MGVFTFPGVSYSRSVTPVSADPVSARPASTVLALRPVATSFEVLMVRRDRRAGFMAGARVFPGGSVDDIDTQPLARQAVSWSGEPEELPWRAAALRELAEEAAVAITRDPADVAGLSGAQVYEAVLAAGTVLDADRLHYMSNWVTPVGVSRRFDTRFYVTSVDGDVAPASDDREVFDAVWVDPRSALRLGDQGDWLVEFPTRAHLELLADLGSVDAVLDHARSATPEPIQPELVTASDGSVSVVVPGGAYGSVVSREG